MDNTENYEIRSAVINKAINYIFDHIDEEITVDDVAHYCSYSRYHLTRMFKEETDEALYQFIKRIRLERSAWCLKVEKEKSITEIGEKYGYSSSNFATAFKKHLNLSPGDFRKTSEQMVEASSFSHGVTLDALDDAGKLITIENLDSFTVIYERKKGNYHQLPQEWCRFIEKYEYLATEETLYMECTIDDPTITDEDHCMYDLCQTVSSEQLVLKKNEHILLQNFQGGNMRRIILGGSHSFFLWYIRRYFADGFQRLGIN